MLHRQVVFSRSYLPVAAFRRHQDHIPVSGEVRVCFVKYADHRNLSLFSISILSQLLPVTVFAHGFSTGKSPVLFTVSRLVFALFQTSIVSLSIQITLPPVSPVTAMVFPPAVRLMLVFTLPTVTFHIGLQITSPPFRTDAPLLVIVTFSSASIYFSGWQ
jgi:hypothetical protein